MTPGVKTGRCYLSTFGFSCSLTCWLKIVAENYCHQLFKKRLDVIDSIEDVGDSKFLEPISNEIDSFSKQDMEVALRLMPNKRYSSIIRFRYIEEKSSEETAEILGMTMENYYNKHRLAKVQLAKILRKENML
ncbi:MAG: sigma-70 family RNA polymerase sigma factor [Bacteroidales bacterium]|nr:sigma-70 family RNA polymerase sigma factor [Bacteroidales bacterium]